MKNIQREEYFNKINLGFKNHSVVALLGPRQSGKTSIAKEYLKNWKLKKNNKVWDFYDLEDVKDQSRSLFPVTEAMPKSGIIFDDSFCCLMYSITCASVGTFGVVSPSSMFISACAKE
jgi:predicted AAA+ superfamily ATPase